MKFEVYEDIEESVAVVLVDLENIENYIGVDEIFFRMMEIGEEKIIENNNRVFNVMRID